MDMQQYLARRAEEIDTYLSRYLPGEDEHPSTLHRAMRYSVNAGGKRLRPVLCIAAAESVGGEIAIVAPVACALELIHTYSLVHDDLPAMDDDDLRRGRPTNHKVFGEGIAILAGDALLTHAFVLLSRQVKSPNALAIIAEIAEAAGARDGMVGGQVVDIESEGKAVTPETLERIHRGKTAALIRASVVAGALAGGATETQVEGFRRFGEKIGLAFQIADDILDVTATTEELGKTAGKDVTAEKATYPALFGLDASRAEARRLTSEALEALRSTHAQTERLEELAQFVVNRRS
jgi:geranylgeranyl diphosphate synthase type II